MNLSVIGNKDLLIRILIHTFLIGVLAHGYAFFNSFYNHDGLVGFVGDEHVTLRYSSVQAKIVTNRFLNALTIYIRGGVSAPWLVGICSLFCIGFANYLLITLLRLRKHLLQFLLCALVVTSPFYVSLLAIYTHELFPYSLAFLGAVLSIYVYERYQKGWIFLPIFMIIVCGLYQPFISIIGVLYLLTLCRRLLETEYFLKIEAYRMLFFVALASIGLVCYLATAKLILKLSGIETGIFYNDPHSIAANALSIEFLLSFPYILLNSLKQMAIFCIRPSYYHQGLIGISTAIMGLLTIAILYLSVIKKKKSKVTFLLLSVLSIGIVFSIDLPNIISRQVRTELTLGASCFFYIIPLYWANYLMELASQGSHQTRFAKFAYKFSITLASLVVVSAVIVAQQTYLQRQLSSDSTLSMMTRVLFQIESTPGYQFNQTPIVFIGTPASSQVAQGRIGFANSQINANHLMDTPHKGYYEAYFKQILAYPIRMEEPILTQDDATPEILSMPVYPQLGSIRMIEGVIYVKFSNF